ncbi:telomerase reverse transcriptase isoform X3 [Engystomops pustulosus]|uniref:telomerase reverse transcriptase isoform X3 n=1 Tax=Engystomops pustulosus TaxID=76066 RepID=UPI003AFAE16A
MEFSGAPLLQAVYWKVFSISDYVHLLHTDSEHKVPVLQEGDTDKYKIFLSELLVCISHKAKKLSSPISFLQLSTQREVVARVIQRICEKQKKNVLAFGYGLVAEKSSFRVKFAPNICNYFPNPSTATISTSVLWETLLSRVGDDVMMHLLENCSLFMTVPPNCFYQICGQPIYKLTTEETLPSPWLKQDCSIYKANILAQHIERCSLTFKGCSLKMSTVRIQHKSARKAHGEIMAETREMHFGSAVGGAITGSRKAKRPLNFDLCDIPAKRRKTELKHTDVNLFNSITAVQKGILDSAAKNFTLSDLIEPETTIKSICTSADRTIPSDIFVDFGKMLYSNPISKEGFSKSFLINMLESNFRGSLNLIERIFMNSNVLDQDANLQVPSESKRKKNVCKRYWQMVPYFRQVIENHKLCPYNSLLKKHCPIQLIGKNKSENVHGNANEDHINTSKTNCKSRNTLEQSLSNAEIVTHHSELCVDKEDEMLVDDPYALLKQHNSIWQVYTFVRECLHIVVPESLWGSSHNKCCFLRNVKMLINSVKCDTISLSELMCKMKVEDCMWVRLNKSNHFVPASEHLLREKILSKLLFWLMDTYVIQLLKAFYYITETSFQKNKLFYYRKSIWQQLQKIGIRKHMTNVKLRLMSTDELESLQQQKNISLVSRLRFIPKTNGLRPIVNMCNTFGAQQSKDLKLRKIQNFNSQIRNLFSVLNYERSKSSNLIGSSVFGLDGIYRKWKNYALKLKESNPENINYFVKTDIKEAYDSIPHSKLKEVISKVMPPYIEEVYCIRRYALLWMDTHGRIRKSFKRHVSNFVDFMPNMKCFVTHLQEGNVIHNAVLVEQSLSLNESSSKLQAFFQQIIFKHILRLNDQIFMRLIDDFLLVTPHLEQAKLFLRQLTQIGISTITISFHPGAVDLLTITLAEGIPEYGCSISINKTVVNFPIDDIPGCSSVQQLPVHSLFRWCGLLLDTKTLEVFCDYSSFSCTSVRSSLSFCHSSKAGENLRNKLLNVLRLKCHSLFLDLQLNSLRTVHINVYKILLLQAYRFHACVIQLPFNQSIKNNPLFFLTVISDMALCFYMIFKEKNKGFILGSKDASGPFPFESAQWLNCHAFITKLSKHKLMYKTLLVPLHHCKRQLSKSLPTETLGLLKELTDISLHNDFSTILD